MVVLTNIMDAIQMYIFAHRPRINEIRGEPAKPELESQKQMLPLA